MKEHPATIKDIAKELNISPSTVSRALKDHFEISEKTKNAVREIAKKLNYKPNSLAVSLKYGKSHTIGVVVPEIVHFFFSSVIGGIEDMAYSRGYTVIISQSDESIERERLNIQTLNNYQVDGLLLSLSKETKQYDHLNNLIDSGLPLVFFDRVAEELNCSKVTVDDFQGAYEATNHLIRKGYKKIAHFAGPSGLAITENRMAGYKKALEDHGLAFGNELVIKDCYSKSESADSVYALIKEENPDALFAFDDLVAWEAIKAAQSYGKNIPIDFGVIGFCNWQFTEMTNPSISTIEQPGFEMGRKAAELLIDQIESKKAFSPVSVSVPTKLIARASTKRP